MTAHETPEPPAKGLPPWLPLTLIGGVFAIIIAVTVLSGGDSTDSTSTSPAPTSTTADPSAPPTPPATLSGLEREPSEVQPVVVTGTRLPPRVKGSDAAVGTVGPEVSGFGLDGRPVSYTNGSPRAVLFLAHWCPHCQAEVDELTAYLTNNDWPTDVEIQTISTWVTADRGNYPPSKWLDDVRWPFAIMADDGAFTAADAYGLSGTPMWVFIDADGVVVERTSALGPEKLLDKVLALPA